MKQFFKSDIVTIGFAVFSMLFGAGNLIYPLLVGMNTGSQYGIAIAAFNATAVLLPLVGLITILLFNGSYYDFFERLGKVPGNIIIFICMLILGPVLVIPRIVTLSHVMLTPFLPTAWLSTVSMGSSFVFALIFLGITFLCTYKESGVVQLLGRIISPLLLLSLLVIISKGFYDATTLLESHAPSLEVITNNLLVGYQTLDLLGAIFFGAIIVSLIKASAGDSFETNKKKAVVTATKAGLLGVSLLAIIYVSMAFLGAYFGHNFQGMDAGSLFREISLYILGNKAGIVIALAVLLACLSTAIALGAVCAEYLQKIVCKSKISYVTALLIVLALCIPLSTVGLSTVLSLADGPLTHIGYPVLIALTLTNLAYKTCGFKPVKIPVAIVFVLATLSYFFL